MGILSFPTPSPPSNIRTRLKQGHWTFVAESMEQGLNPLVRVDDIPLYSFVLQSWAQQYAQDNAAVLPLQGKIKDVWVEVAPPNFEEKTAICWASYYGQWGLASELLNKGFPVDTPHWSLWDAILFGFMERLPLQQKTITQLSGNELSLKVTEPLSSFYIAQHDTLALLMHQAKTKTSSWPDIMHSSSSPLLLSIILHQFRMVENFLDLGVSPNIVVHPNHNIEGSPKRFMEHLFPIQVAIESGNHLALELLIQRGADTSLPLQDNYSVLDCAVLTKQMTCLDVLLKMCPQPDVKRMLPFAMIYAVAENNMEAIEKLLNAGGSLFVKTASGYNLLHQAAMSGDKGMVDFLIAHGLKMTSPADNGVTPLDLMKEQNPSLYEHFSDNNTSNIVPFSFHKIRK